MEYTINNFARLTGVSTRTLRYYDEICLLQPARINSSGYRIYGRKEVDQMQQILFYKTLGVSLAEIKEILSNPQFDRINALYEHHVQLLDQKKQLDMLIRNVEKTIAAIEGGGIMSDKEKFEGLKKKLVAENEKAYGEEIREKYGEETVRRSNEKMLNMTEAEYEEVTRREEEFIDVLKQAMDEHNPGGELAQKAADLHRQWLCFY